MYGFDSFNQLVFAGGARLLGRVLWQAGDRVIFLDMAHYSMVKSTTFNGIKLPSIALCNSRLPDVRVMREFTYEDYRNRLS